MSLDQPVIEIKDLTKKYGSFVALDRLTFNVERGQILGFVGPNGAGKTTTIRILVGLARPTSGSAKIAGVDCVKDSRKIKKMVGYMPDVFGSYDNMRVSEYLDFFGAAFGIPRKERARRISQVLGIAGASTFKDLYLEALSHGMKQRVAISRILLHDPEVLILDEPANGLDPIARIEMRELLLSLADQGKTLLVTSHILPELARVCHRVAIITRGQLRGFGTLKEISRQLSQLRSMEVLLVRGDQLERAASEVRKYMGVGGEIQLSPTEATIRFRTAVGEEGLAKILSSLVSAGIVVEQFREVQTDLEEAYLTIAMASKQENQKVRA